MCPDRFVVDYGVGAVRVEIIPKVIYYNFLSSGSDHVSNLPGYIIGSYLGYLAGYPKDSLLRKIPTNRYGCLIGHLLVEPGG
jgi:hypothetical protein